MQFYDLLCPAISNEDLSPSPQTLELDQKLLAARKALERPLSFVRVVISKKHQLFSVEKKSNLVANIFPKGLFNMFAGQVNFETTLTSLYEIILKSKVYSPDIGKYIETSDLVTDWREFDVEYLLNESLPPLAKGGVLLFLKVLDGKFESPGEYAMRQLRHASKDHVVIFPYAVTAKYIGIEIISNFQSHKVQIVHNNDAKLIASAPFGIAKLALHDIEYNSKLATFYSRNEVINTLTKISASSNPIDYSTSEHVIPFQSLITEWPFKTDKLLESHYKQISQEIYALRSQKKDIANEILSDYNRCSTVINFALAYFILALLFLAYKFLKTAVPHVPPPAAPRVPSPVIYVYKATVLPRIKLEDYGLTNSDLDEHEALIPQILKCPISDSIMLNPVDLVVQGGKSLVYDRENLDQWYRLNPNVHNFTFTNEHVISKEFYPNITVRNEVIRTLDEIKALKNRPVDNPIENLGNRPAPI